MVETTRFSDMHSYQGSTKDRHLFVRFTRTDADTVLYQFTIDDPGTWMAPWMALDSDAVEPAAAARVRVATRRTTLLANILGAARQEEPSREAGQD